MAIESQNILSKISIRIRLEVAYLVVPYLLMSGRANLHVASRHDTREIFGWIRRACMPRKALTHTKPFTDLN